MDPPSRKAEEADERPPLFFVEGDVDARPSNWTGPEAIVPSRADTLKIAKDCFPAHAGRRSRQTDTQWPITYDRQR